MVAAMEEVAALTYRSGMLTIVRSAVRFSHSFAAHEHDRRQWDPQRTLGVLCVQDQAVPGCFILVHK